MHKVKPQVLVAIEPEHPILSECESASWPLVSGAVEKAIVELPEAAIEDIELRSQRLLPIFLERLRGSYAIRCRNS